MQGHTMCIAKPIQTNVYRKTIEKPRQPFLTMVIYSKASIDRTQIQFEESALMEFNL